MRFTIHKADKRHLSDINRLIVEARIGESEDALDGQFWVARVSGQIVGCVGGKMIDGNTAALTYLAVDSSYRRQGIGMSLFNHAVNHFCSRGATTVGFITMYYHFNRFKRRGFCTVPRKFLSEPLKSHWMFTARQYMKCAAMVRTFPARAS
jgi:N-acetylglutamate synthase-like GNAT family acetyltransferase